MTQNPSAARSGARTAIGNASRPRAAVVALALGAFALGALACNTSHETTAPKNNDYTNVPPPAGGVAQFSVIPVAVVPGQTLTALGNLNPPGHVLPTDHVYFYSWDISKRGATVFPTARAVYMPTTAAAFFVLPGSNGEYKIMYRATENFYFYFAHLVASPVPKVGDIITAGTPVGATTPGGTLDLGAFDTSVSHDGFMNTARYGISTLNVVSPWKYFTPALQAQLYPQLYRAPAATDKDGRIDFGIAGKLAGDWFLQGMPVDSSGGPYGWTRTVSFAYDYYDPTQPRISVGGTIGPAGVWAIDPSAPLPNSVSVASGVVKYLLYSPFDAGFPPQGLVIVQMTSDTQIKIGYFPGVTTTNRDFDANASIFVR